MACSGAMYSGVPMAMPGFVRRLESWPRLRAMPKSSTLTKSALAVARDEEDVLGLEIAVDDAGGVRGLERAADLHGDLRGAHRLEAPLVREHVGEVDAVEVLHDEVGAAVLGRAEVGDVDDVRVADARGRARLAAEALDESCCRE